jgi:hypothetical protein
MHPQTYTLEEAAAAPELDPALRAACAAVLRAERAELEVSVCVAVLRIEGHTELSPSAARELERRLRAGGKSHREARAQVAAVRAALEPSTAAARLRALATNLRN